jgi:hypothetical protein
LEKAANERPVWLLDSSVGAESKAAFKARVLELLESISHIVLEEGRRSVSEVEGIVVFVEEPVWRSKPPLEEKQRTVKG